MHTNTEKRKQLEDERKKLAAEYENSIKQWALLPASDEEGWAKARATRDEIAHRLQENYWHLDPLVRARSLYDRLGMLPGSTALHTVITEGTQTAGDDQAQTVIPQEQTQTETASAVSAAEMKNAEVDTSVD